MLADDSVTIRDVVEQTFTDEGLDVTTVTNGEEAMQKIAEVQPDILILDVNMPEPTGYKICETIKQDELTRHIPVLLIVGSFEPFDQSEAERVGADGFLTKPFQSIRDLIVRVEELIGTQHRPASPAETADIDNLFDRSFSDTNERTEELNVEMFLGDPGMDDEIIEASYPSRDAPVDDDDLVILTKVGAGVGALSCLDDAFEPPLVNDDGRAVINHTQEEPSEEFIALVTRRVVEKLSDKVVREIAKESVPRIAEKLIREALEEDEK